MCKYHDDEGMFPKNWKKRDHRSLNASTLLYDLVAPHKGAEHCKIDVNDLLRINKLDHIFLNPSDYLINQQGNATTVLTCKHTISALLSWMVFAMASARNGLSSSISKPLMFQVFGLAFEVSVLR